MIYLPAMLRIARRAGDLRIYLGAALAVAPRLVYHKVRREKLLVRQTERIGRKIIDLAIGRRDAPDARSG